MGTFWVEIQTNAAREEILGRASGRRRGEQKKVLWFSTPILSTAGQTNDVRVNAHLSPHISPKNLFRGCHKFSIEMECQLFPLRECCTASTPSLTGSICYQVWRSKDLSFELQSSVIFFLSPPKIWARDVQLPWARVEESTHLTVFWWGESELTLFPKELSQREPASWAETRQNSRKPAEICKNTPG